MSYNGSSSDQIKHDWAVIEVNLQEVMKTLSELAFTQEPLNEDRMDVLWDRLTEVHLLAYRHTLFRYHVDRFGPDGAHDDHAQDDDELYDHNGPVRARAWADIEEEDGFLPPSARRDIGGHVPLSGLDYVFEPATIGHPRHGTDAAIEESRASSRTIWKMFADLYAGGFLAVKRDDQGRMVTRPKADGSPGIVYVITPAGEAQCAEWDRQAQTASDKGVDGKDAGAAETVDENG